MSFLSSMGSSIANSGVPIVSQLAGGASKVAGAVDPSLVNKLDPTKVGTSTAKITGPTAPTGPAPQQAVPTQGPNGTTIAQTAGPQAANVNFNTSTQYGSTGQNAQNALMAQLAAQSRGQGPSLAAQQLQQGQQANLAATMAQLASTRGAANPLAARTAMQTAGDTQAATNQQAAQARIQEQLNAQNELASVANNSANQGLTQRAQDIGVASTDAANAQAANLAGYQGNLQTNLDQANINANNANALFSAQQQASANNANQQANYNNLLANYANMNLQAQEGNAGISQANAKQSAADIGGLVNAGSGIAGGYFNPASGSGAQSSPLASIGAAGASAFAAGGKIPGKAKVSGDSYANDTVHAMLSPGEVVLPRSVTTSYDPIKAAVTFLKDHGYGKGRSSSATAKRLAES